MTDRDEHIAFLRTVQAVIAVHEAAIRGLTRQWDETVDVLRADGMDPIDIRRAVDTPSDQTPPDPSE